MIATGRPFTPWPPQNPFNEHINVGGRKSTLVIYKGHKVSFTLTKLWFSFPFGEQPQAFQHVTFSSTSCTSLRYVDFFCGLLLNTVVKMLIPMP